MGGVMSTRWGAERTRLATAEVPHLRIGEIRKAGALVPGAISTYTFMAQGKQIGSVTIVMEDAGRLRVEFMATARGQPPVHRQINVSIDYTSCHLGGRRAWFCCPSCGRRRTDLYLREGWFACWRCQDLAPTTTQLSPTGRLRHRFLDLRHRLDPSAGALGWEIPDRPKGMHWATYIRIVEEMAQVYHEHTMMVIAAWEPARRRIMARLPQALSQDA